MKPEIITLEILTEKLKSKGSGKINSDKLNAVKISGHYGTGYEKHVISDDLRNKNLVKAAVLVPVVKRKEGLTVLFNKRAEDLEIHAGQVCFPGGHIEEYDENEIAAALRETEEETGIKKEKIKVIGCLDNYVTATGFFVTPVVGFLTPPLDINIDKKEVAEVFEVPLSYLFDKRNYRSCEMEVNGQKKSFYEVLYDGYRIWGATAGMLINFYDIVMES